MKNSTGRRNWLHVGLSSALVVLLVAYFTAFCIINFAGFSQFCTGDMYEDTYVARLMWEQKTLFPDGWVFGNQFYVFATPVLAALFYGITGSMNLAMALATTAMTAAMLAAFWWMLLPFTERRERLLGTAVLVAAVMGPDLFNDIEPQIFYIFASYYAAYAITLFVVFGDYLRVRTGRRSALLSPGFVIALILSFCTGMNSLRQTAVMVLPLIVLEGAWFASGALWARRFGGTVERPPVPGMFHVLSISAANLLGCVVIRLISPAQVTIFSGYDLTGLARLKEHFSTALRALRSITGLKYLLTERFNLWLGLFAAALVILSLTALVRICYQWIVVTIHWRHMPPCALWVFWPSRPPVSYWTFPCGPSICSPGTRWPPCAPFSWPGGPIGSSGSSR